MFRLETRTERMRDLNEQLRAANAECKARREELEKLNAELAHANAKLIELEDVRAQFTLLVTHELRAPVAAIQSYLKLILEGYVPENKVRETLVKAERRAMEQLALIADLLELGRIGSADARARCSRCTSRHSLREQVDLLAVGARERGITVQAEIATRSAARALEPRSDQEPLEQPDQQRDQVQPRRRPGGHHSAADDDRLWRQRQRHRHRHPAGGHAAALLRVLPRRQRQALGSHGHRPGSVHRQRDRGARGGKITVESELGQGTTFRFWLPAMKG